MHSLEDLIRFATHQYTNDPAQLGNNFIHLTNYSVNKENKEGFVHAEVLFDHLRNMLQKHMNHFPNYHILISFELESRNW